MDYLKEIILNGKILDAGILAEEQDTPIGESHFEQETLKRLKALLAGEDLYSFKTSGSTGSPKEITFSSRQVERSAKRSIEAFGLKPGHTLVCCLNTEFVAGFMMLARAVVGDMRLVIKEPSANPFDKMDYPGQIDLIAMTPMQVKSVLESIPGALENIRTLLVGGAPIDEELELQLAAYSPAIYHSYAMTETLTHVALRRVNGPMKSEWFTALEGVKFSLDSRQCLVITDRLLGLENLVSNDIAELKNSQTFKWIGRADRVINSGGIKLNLDQAEEAVRKILGLLKIRQRFCLVAIPDERLTQKMIMLLEGPGNSPHHQGLFETLKQQLPKYHAPVEIVAVPKLYLTASGKIDRIRNAETYILTGK